MWWARRARVDRNDPRAASRHPRPMLRVSALDAGLYSIGIPKDSVVKYELALKSDKFLVLAHGTTDEVAKAKTLCNRPVQ